MSSADAPLSVDEAERLLHHPTQQSIAQFNGMISSGRSPESWKNGSPGQNRGLTICGDERSKNNLHNIHLDGLNFGPILRLEHCTFELGSRIRGVTCTRVVIKHCIFNSCDLSALHWTGVEIEDCVFTDCSFTDITWINATLLGTKVRRNDSMPAINPSSQLWAYLVEAGSIVFGKRSERGRWRLPSWTRVRIENSSLT
jgi:hypothetical protein